MRKWRVNYLGTIVNEEMKGKHLGSTINEGIKHENAFKALIDNKEIFNLKENACLSCNY